jgi:signal transduction histidine kinase
VAVGSRRAPRRTCISVLCIFFWLIQVRAFALGTRSMFAVVEERPECRLYLSWRTLAGPIHQLTWSELLIALTLAVFLWAFHLLRLRGSTRRVQRRLSDQIDARERMAYELHDSLLQGFQGIALQVQGIAKRIPGNDPLRCEIEEVLDRADEALSETRQRMSGLRASTTTFDLPDRIARCGRELSARYPASFALAIVGQQRELESMVHDEAYAIAGEALRNAFLHAAASMIEVEITYAPALLRVRVRDDGVGIAYRETKESHLDDWRLVGMCERAKAVQGELQIWSHATAGTEIELVVPAVIAYSPKKDKTS